MMFVLGAMCIADDVLVASARAGNSRRGPGGRRAVVELVAVLVQSRWPLGDRQLRCSTSLRSLPISGLRLRSTVDRLPKPAGPHRLSACHRIAMSRWRRSGLHRRGSQDHFSDTLDTASSFDRAQERLKSSYIPRAAAQLHQEPVLRAQLQALHPLPRGDDGHHRVDPRPVFHGCGHSSHPEWRPSRYPRRLQPAHAYECRAPAQRHHLSQPRMARGVGRLVRGVGQADDPQGSRLRADLQPHGVLLDRARTPSTAIPSR